jgi:cell division protein FtsB
VSHERSQYQSQLSVEDRRTDVIGLQAVLDDLKDENITLKLKVAELESEVLDEKQRKQMKYDLTVDTLKSQVQE